MAKVLVEMLAEQGSYSYPNSDGTHTREDYVRGQKFLMEESEAQTASEGEASGPPTIQKNHVGTYVWTYPPKTPGVPRAAVRIVPDGGKPTKPVKAEMVVPAPAPKPAGTERDR